MSLFKFSVITSLLLALAATAFGQTSVGSAAPILPPPATTNATSTIQLAWSPGSLSAGVNYVLYQGTNSSAYDTTYKTGSNVAYTVSNLVRGQTYYFAVVAVGSTGVTSPYSTEASFISATIPGSPQALRVILIAP